ncbi:uncharacterized protein HMPREF1541_09885 [Cyphellophora europaea CBS 101466]|uniref:Alpha/beta hydrolase fold-3 domain-containing protein n=1 Tax=Cyphellophora europaea (strain CBS 101466) TaxID=1220924 RepID=W2SAS9_CYPE1|nr:uncharacterized protein HMPREF1541_09885 [Cyphellophora europaea CBS 101466]ETN45009.1 hypothetical protein HMPREF1541_09885 [Cyphellophora europaea CBS 101466]
MPLAFDPAWLPALEPLLPILTARPVPKIHDVQTRRDNLAVLGELNSKLPDPGNLVQERLTFTSYDGASVDILYSHRVPLSMDAPTAAIVHAHGGGYIAGSVDMFAKNIALWAAEHGVPTFSVNYRKAPEHPHPTPVEDYYAGLKFVQTNASRFNIDPARIAVFGESAGGGLAAAAALLARDRQLDPPIAKQVLVYPMLDDRNLTPIPGIEPFAVWNCESNIMGWTALLGADKAGKEDADVSPYAAPARARSLEGLPRTYMDCGELDIFKSEDLEYVSRLARANVSVEFHLYPGVPHVFEALAPEIWASKAARANRIRALQDF